MVKWTGYVPRGFVVMGKSCPQDMATELNSERSNTMWKQWQGRVWWPLFIFPSVLQKNMANSVLRLSPLIAMVFYVSDHTFSRSKGPLLAPICRDKVVSLLEIPQDVRLGINCRFRIGCLELPPCMMFRNWLPLGWDESKSKGPLSSTSCK